ncbi:MAG: Asp-tRNA(Asn)/Glu-tRNA(Gln) amidotransferase subunit GatB [Candidatus Omnitrophica bacterium]|nr:Asp-tRNA(Asn)/Glu-tRNA(Gln) amidotransferase subunit GatB [Candidatus Omnitrophota bacterium]MBU4303390.1 Asp-tRNA(Asn)/Glu-tRNA(Gln) amidotransferase subunit GatB [Candidatus Omnitrophota bacterium]MBU4418747.1 Asp-tRNA(Asn)/Glu-tRNA(Gln) amidotransferase subunit GatB [Candidatus Omnitrophota bacterium]MBU4468776.1 Asp-tRNA(Asn)/Glu-tRNA(Gln) amidotransferase subunit GatB [Candidatus Omnitrophota bacterium]MCG2708063.1 Asp-tRNA(Asn)/Glu-tRNA(Gln) amidotransferase subunit GatB [Candidatus Om
MKYQTVIGLEVHLQLNTKTKAFCGCSTDFGKAPNSNVCPVCLGFPGALPVYNHQALNSAIKLALAFGCQIQEHTKFDRKNYFYPDLPKNYQISQFDLPLSRNGYLDIYSQDKPKRIGITRVHLEEDAGKLIHETGVSLVDFNRTGIPLLEIVSEPDLFSPQEAFDYLTSLKSIIEYLDVSDCDMEKGSLRCDANISLRLEGAKELGVKTELKNMNSFKGVKDALTFEVERQTLLLEANQKLVQETRLWDVEKGVTVAMRTKEGAKDYRYFPDPDLTVFIIDASIISQIKAQLPELPPEKMRRFVKEYGLTEYDAKILVSSKNDAEFSESCIRDYPGKDKKELVNWLIGPLLSEANFRKIKLHELNLNKNELISLIGFVERQDISHLSAKSVLSQLLDTGKSARDLIEEGNLKQISNAEALLEVMETVIQENAKSVSDFKAGKTNALMYLVGQVMKKSSGKANPKVVGELIRRRLTDA